MILMTSEIELNIILDLIPLSTSIQQRMMELLYARLQAHAHAIQWQRVEVNTPRRGREDSWDAG